jgi:hypothetical protein
MKSIKFFSNLIFILFLIMLIVSPGFSQTEQDTLVDEIIIKVMDIPFFNSHANGTTILSGIKALDSLNRLFGCSSMQPLFPEKQFPGLKKSKSLSAIYDLKFSKKLSARALISSYLQIGAIEHAQIIRTGKILGTRAVIPNDQYFYRQWPFYNNGTFSYNGIILAKAGADMKVTEAWDIQKGDSAIIVAILDSGCWLTHDEFKGRIWQNKGEIPGNGIDDDNNGYVDDFQGWNFVGNNNNPEDNNGHGTGIASDIAANSDNGIGYAGMDWKCKIMIIKTTDSLGIGKNSDLAKGILYAANNGVKIINISIAMIDTDYVVNQAIEYAFSKGVVICCGSGNNNREGISPPSSNSKTISVGSTGPDDKRSKSFVTDSTGGSNYGQGLDVVAPGNYVTFLTIPPNDYNAIGGGTSISTAFVSGLASLMLAQNPSLTPTQVKDIICQTADDQVGDTAEDKKGWDKYYGYGRVNALNALTFVKNGVLLESKGSKTVRHFQATVLPNGGISILCNGNNALKSSDIKVYNLKGIDITAKYLPKSNSISEITLVPYLVSNNIIIVAVKNGEKKEFARLALVKK